MIIWIDVEIHLTKIYYTSIHDLMKQRSENQKIKGNLIKCICKNYTTNILAESLNKIGKNIKMTTFIICILHCTGGPSKCKTTKKK